MRALIADYRKSNSFATRFRRGRLRFFLSLYPPGDQIITILDIGGTEEYWKQFFSGLNLQFSITLLNINKQPDSPPIIRSIIADGLSLCFADQSFDIVFSNSTIEHVGDDACQRRMASEIKRVGRRYFIQTPNRNFIIEPHFLFPFFQFLPQAVQVWLLTHFSMGWYGRFTSQELARREITSIRMLSKGELLGLFPGCRLHQEKVFGMTKSYVAYSM